MHLDPQKDVEIMEDHGGEDIKQEEIFNNPIFVEGECEDVVKVQLDDTNNAPLDIDVDEHGTANAGAAPLVDMALHDIASHTAPVYAVANNLSDYGEDGFRVLRIVSGGGDNKAFWHEVPFPTNLCGNHNGWREAKTWKVITNFKGSSAPLPVIIPPFMTLISLNHPILNGWLWEILKEGKVMLSTEVTAVVFSESSFNWCATGGMDGVLKIWDLADKGHCLHACRVAATNPPGNGITQLTWHPYLPVVIASTCQGQIHLWDARHGQLLQTLTGHVSVINDVDVSFDPPSMEEVIESLRSGNGRGQDFSMIVTASDDNTVRFFRVDIGAALERAAATRQLQSGMII